MTSLEIKAEVGRGSFKMDVSGLDLKPAAIRHRVEGIDNKIHQHLFDLTSIRLDAPEVFAQMEDHVDVVAGERLEHHVHVSDDRVQVEYPGLKNLFAPERQELPRHRSRFLRSVVDQKQLGTHGMVIGQAAEQNFASPDDDGQKVVEIMSDTAGQSSNRFHFMDAPDLFLQATPLFLSASALADFVA